MEILKLLAIPKETLTAEFCVDLTAICTEEGSDKIIEGVPNVRVTFAATKLL